LLYERFVHDDAFYEIQIAWNMAHGQGSTWDGIHPTNGYQPLWTWMLAGISLAAPDKFLAWRLSLVVCILLRMAAVLLLLRVTRQLAPWYGRAIGVLFWWMFVPPNQAMGLESDLFALFALLTVVYILRLPTHEAVTSWSAQALFAGLLVGVFLARTDGIFLVTTALLAVSLRAPEADRSVGALPSAGRVFRPPWLSILVFAVVFTVYLLGNLLAFGTAMPISGRLKTSFPVILWDRIQWSFVLPLKVWVPLAGTLLVLGRLLWLTEKRKAEGWVAPVGRALAAGALAMLAQVTFTVLFFDHEFPFAVAPWHFTLAGAVFALALPLGIAAIQRHTGHDRLAPVAALLVALALLAFVPRTVARFLPIGPEGPSKEAIEVAEWLRTQSGKSEIAAATDCGAVGFFSGRTVINLDGLTNNLDYQRWLTSRPLEAYLRATGVKWLLVYGHAEDGKFRVRCALDRRTRYYRVVGVGPAFLTRNRTWSAWDLRHASVVEVQAES